MPLTVMGELEQVRPSRDGWGEESKEEAQVGRPHSVSWIQFPFCIFLRV